ncbi:MAG TPA: NYN domain-containing protein [Candidatus Fermentibacter daniensis]|nr:NYN domain-containing protein [Candidatus Fermentibacter daniensis]HQE56753.1 NYN domain-containing protein [Candidatus Fermentibacter daniensis]HQH92877.1 NYN domain-containing protein [Candidatus Fermentibacter daniensis]
MDRVTVFVDAGYLFAQGSLLLSGRKVKRSEIDLDEGKAILILTNLASEIARVPLLRVYWYDGSSYSPTLQQQKIADLPGVKLRLGLVNSSGEQKGVDSLIITDMIELARNRAMSDALLLSGDEDLRVCVEQAQEFGVRVHLLGIEPARGNQSPYLLREADTTHELKRDTLISFMSVKPEVREIPANPDNEGNVVDSAQVDSADYLEAAKEVALSVSPEDAPVIVSEFHSTGCIPADIDRPLLAIAGRILGVNLEPWQKRALRSRLIFHIERAIEEEKSNQVQQVGN